MSNPTQNRPLQSIIPPHILRAIALKSQDVAQRNRAIHVLSLDHTHRSARTIRSQHRLHFPHEHTLVTAKAKVQRTIYDAHGTMDDWLDSIVRAEGDKPVSDPAVNEAYDGLGWTHASICRSTGAILLITKDCHCRRSFTTAHITIMPFGMGHG